jgi:hypothetical protein
MLFFRAGEDSFNFATFLSHIVLWLGTKMVYKDADIISQLWNICKNGKIIMSYIQTYIYRHIYLNISKKHTVVHSASEFK